jgi:hypothetical protein
MLRNDEIWAAESDDHPGWVEFWPPLAVTHQTGRTIEGFAVRRGDAHAVYVWYRARDVCRQYRPAFCDYHNLIRPVSRVVAPRLRLVLAIELWRPPELWVARAGSWFPIDSDLTAAILDALLAVAETADGL